MTLHLLLLGMVLGVGLTLAGERMQRPTLEWVGKPLASALFILAAFHHGGPTTSWGYAILAALVFSAIGDVALIAKGRGPGFLTGLVAFLLGHVAYSVAFVTAGPDPARLLVAAALLVPFSVVIARALVRRAERHMALPVMAYVAVITVMVALAFAVNAGPLLPLAAVLFFVSDLFVARQRFVEKAFINRALGLPIYYAAQLLFALHA